MVSIASHSSHWRVTCGYDKFGEIQRDSVLFKLSNFNPFKWQGSGVCMKSEYLNIKGHVCSGCTSTWYQPTNEFLHLDTSFVPCEFGKWPLSDQADAFGFYRITDSTFRCTSDNSATTNHWLGGYL